MYAYHQKTCRLQNCLTSEPPTAKFRHTTPGSGKVLVTKHKPQPTSELFDPTYPGAHLPLNRRHFLAPRWISPHLTLYAFPKAFLTKPDAPYHEPYAPRPYPAPTTRRPEQRTADMSMQFIAFHSRVVLRPTVRTKIKRRLREAVRLIVTRGAAVEESRDGVPKLVFRAEDVGADKWIVPGACVLSIVTSPSPCRSFHGIWAKTRGAVCFMYLSFTHVLHGRLDVYGVADHHDVPYAVYGAT